MARTDDREAGAAKTVRAADAREGDPPHETAAVPNTSERSVEIGGDVIHSSLFTGDITGDIYINSGERGSRGSAPPRPSLMMGRDDDVREMKTRLGITPGSGAANSLQVVTAVRGWSGVGKTTLVAALTHDPEVRAAYPDGVLWTSLRHDPSILSKLAEWGRALGTDTIVNSENVEEASARLTALLRDRRMLLIVDDVWDARHARPFGVGGSGCAMLLTTRSKSVAQQLAPTNDAIYKLGVLSVEVAMELLHELAPAASTLHARACRELVEHLDRLPLALQVAGRLLHSEAENGFDSADLLDELNEGAKLLQSEAPIDLTDVARETTPTVAALLRKSTDRLDEHTRDCFAYLGVFAPEPASFDLAALKAVWEVSDPKPIVVRLIERGLLEPAGAGRFQLHSLLALHAKSFLT